MKEILVSGNRSCFCNSGKKFKVCHGMGISSDIEDTYKLHFILKDIYTKVLSYVRTKYGLKDFLEDFKRYNKAATRDDNPNLEGSFVFIDFLLFRAKLKDKSSLVDDLLISRIFDSKELIFLKELVDSSFFSIFKVVSVDSSKGYVEMENLFEEKAYGFYDKNCSSVVKEGGLIYGRIYEIFSRIGILPAFSFRSFESLGEADLKNIKESFDKRYENLQKEGTSLSFKEFVDSIEYEVFGGEDPYQEYELDERFEKFQKEHPDKDFNDFLDLIEDEILGLNN